MNQLRQYQHISFSQVVFWGGQYELGTEETWNEVVEEFLKASNELVFPSIRTESLAEIELIRSLDFVI